MSKIKKTKIKILQKKRAKNMTDSFFYSGDIATATKANGTKLYLIADGDIAIQVQDKLYRNPHVEQAIDEYKLTDKRLAWLEKQGVLTWVNNNWFEVVWTKKGSDVMDSDIGEVVYDYDEAIQLLKDYINNDEY